MPKIVDHNAQRRLIVTAAIAVINLHGIDGTRLRDVAAAMGVTTGTVTHYFVSKDALLEAVLDDIIGRTIERMETHRVKNAPWTISSFINEAIYHLPINEENQAEWRVWLAFCGRAIADADLKRIHRRHYRKIVSRIMLLLQSLRFSRIFEAKYQTQPSEPIRFQLENGSMAVLAIPEKVTPQIAMPVTFHRQVHRCAEAVIAAIEGIGMRATLDPDRWPLWSQAEAIVELLTPMLEAFIEAGLKEREQPNYTVKITRMAA